MASTYLSRTSTTGSRRIGTFSAWVKRGSLGTLNSLLDCYTATEVTWFNIRFSASDEIQAIGYDATSGFQEQFELRPSRVFRDTSAWYHIVFSWDSTQATESNRLKFYVNGVQETSFARSVYPSQNEDFYINYNSIPYWIGRGGWNDNYFNGEMAHVHVVDGTAYDADTFGETDATTGIWKPKTAPSVTYGTNGFFLKFENSGAFGTDSSGNANNFTVNGTMTQTIDTPSNVFATGNSLEKPIATGSYSNGNLTFQTSNSTWDSLISTISPTQGKWYFEAKPTTLSSNGDFIIGMVDRDKYPDWYSNQLPFKYIGYKGVCYIGSGDYFLDNATPVTGLTTTSVNDIVGCAIDLDNNFAYFSVNGTFLNSGVPTSGATGTGGQNISTVVQSGSPKGFGVSSKNSSVIQCNFGNGYFGTTAVSSAQNPDDGIGIFEYDVPTGYRALCTKSINAEEYS